MNAGLRWCLLGLAFLFGSEVIVFCAARETGPAFAEVARINAVQRAQEILQGIAGEGLGSLLARGPSMKDIAAFGALPSLLSAWATLGPVRLGLVDSLVGHRFGWICIAALAPAALYWCAWPALGRRVAGFAAVSLLVMPRWLHAAAVGSKEAVLAAFWLLVLAAYLRSLPRPGVASPRQCWALAGAVTLGLALAWDLAALWVLLLVAVHFVATRRRTLKASVRRGKIALPSIALYSVVLAPLTMFALSPELWRTSTRNAVRHVLGPLGPNVEDTVFLGDVVTKPPVPGSFAAIWLAGAVPSLVAAFALIGAARWAHDYYRSRAFEGAAHRDPWHVGALVGLVLVAVVLGPGLAPDVLTVFPPRALIALPFVALLSGMGLEFMAGRVSRPFVGDASVAAVLVVCAWFATRDITTAAAEWSLNLGGTARVADARLLPVRDGSELGVLAASIDALGHRRVDIRASRVPREYWKALEQVGRMQTRVAAGGGVPTLEVHDEERSDSSASVTRSGVVLWALEER